GISPAKFTTGGLNISPATVKAGGKVNISVLVTNSGDLKGNRSITLQIDGSDVQTREVALNGSENTTIDFTFTAEKIGVHSVKIDGLEGKFEVLPASATFEIKLLTVSPVEISTGDEARFRVLVTNTSGFAGTCNVTLKMDGVISEVRQVTVSANASQELTFVASPNAAGNHDIDINGAQALLTVRDKTPEIAPIPEPVAQSPAPEPQGFNKWLLAGIIAAGALAILAAVYLLRLRKRKNNAPPTS
ncbi:MAG: hypothetical protein Q8N46_02790, partial [Anaerolineales bacterium]|nr:hypothetical protein [Anaerolineales bacterium]